MAKRRATETDGDGEMSVDITALLDQHKLQISQEISGMGTALEKSTHHLIKQVDASNQLRFAKQDNKIDDISRRLLLLEKAKPVCDTYLEKLTVGLAAASSMAPPIPVLDNDFDRPIDPTVVRIRSVEPVRSAAALAALQEMLNSMGEITEKDYKIEGKELSRAFTLRFGGAPGLAANRARKFLGLQRENGAWKELECGTTANGKSRLYLDVDKNRKTQRGELISRKLSAILKTAHPDHDIFLKKAALTISSRWTPLARVLEVTGSDYRIGWNTALVASLRVGRDEVEAALTTALAEPADMVQWG
jgi:hypothetical protein